MLDLDTSLVYPTIEMVKCSEMLKQKLNEELFKICQIENSFFGCSTVTVHKTHSNFHSDPLGLRLQTCN